MFRLSDYRAFLADNAGAIADFQQRREAAFAAERAMWERNGEFDRVAALTEEAASDGGSADAIDLPDGCDLVEAPFGGSLWKLLVAEGAVVEAGETIAIIEAMKMESAVTTPVGGRIRRVYVQERQAISPGAPMLAVEAA